MPVMLAGSRSVTGVPSAGGGASSSDSPPGPVGSAPSGMTTSAPPSLALPTRKVSPGARVPARATVASPMERSVKTLKAASEQLSMLIVDVFDTAGTLIGVATRANLLTEDGKLPRLSRALLSDSTATVVGAVAGTASTTSYIESAAGVEAGGRTGLTAVVCGTLFLVCLFFAPLAQSVPAYATASALLFVACLMARSLADIDWNDITESAPAVIAAIAMPLSFSIAEGIGLGSSVEMLEAAYGGPSYTMEESPFVVGEGYWTYDLQTWTGLWGFATGQLGAHAVTAINGGQGCGE